eukprot:m.37132 g.37132  ORF g.37132 m.37132 type:complete len:401 (+) comp12994_c0_seq1:65-1267(+)
MSSKKPTRAVVQWAVPNVVVQCGVAFGVGYAAWQVWEWYAAVPPTDDRHIPAPTPSSKVTGGDESNVESEKVTRSTLPAVAVPTDHAGLRATATDRDTEDAPPAAPAVPTTDQRAPLEATDGAQNPPIPSQPESDSHGSNDDHVLLDTLDKCYASRDHDRSVTLIRAKLADPKNRTSASRIPLMWRLARAERTLVAVARAATKSTSTANRTRLVKARELVEEAEGMFDDGVAAAGGSGAVAAEESNFAKAMVHKWLAIIWNDLGDIDGKRAKIENGGHFAQHLERAMALAPDDATLRYMHGRFCTALAELSWVKRTLAATIFGREPPQATWSDALASFESAARLRPVAAPMDQLGIAECHIKLGARPKARAALARCLAAVSSTNEDDDAHETARKLLVYT